MQFKKHVNLEPGTSNNHVLMVFFDGMILNLYMENGCFTKHPFKIGCLGPRVPGII